MKWQLTNGCLFSSVLLDPLEEALRDRFVCGLSSEAIQRRLLSEPKLTLAKVMEFAQGMEAADHDSRRLKGQEQHIKKVVGTPVKPQSSTQSCYRCGKPNRTPAECRYRDAICNACGKTEGPLSSSLSF